MELAIVKLVLPIEFFSFIGCVLNTVFDIGSIAQSTVNKTNIAIANVLMQHY